MARFGGGSSTINFMDDLEHDESAGARTLFVGNLDVRVTRKMLYELMIQAGPVEAVRIVPPRDNTPRTFSFVRFEHAVSVRYALLVLRDVKLFRSSLILNFSGPNKARPRPDYPPKPTTFFELPLGLEDSPKQTPKLLIKKKAISDSVEYISGYYPHDHQRQEKDNLREDSDDDGHYYRPPPRDKMAHPRDQMAHSRNYPRDSFRNEYDYRTDSYRSEHDYRTESRGRGRGTSSHQQGRHNGDGRSYRPAGENQHIRFDENFGKKKSVSSKKTKSEAPVEEGESQRRRIRKKSAKKSRKEQDDASTSSSAKRKRVH